MSTTGEHAAVPDVKPVDVVAKQLPGRIFQPGALTLVTTLAIGLVAGGSGIVYAQSVKSEAKAEAKQIADAGASAAMKALDQHIKDEAEARAAQLRFNERVMDAFQASEERSAKRFDALQNTVLTRTPQPESAELARPAPVKDGGR